MEYRRNLLTREWVVYGPEIIEPESLIAQAQPRQETADLFPGEETPCPYCPESLGESPDILSIQCNGLPPGGIPQDAVPHTDPWDIKVIAALRPVFRIETPLNRHPRRLHDVMEAPGAHEKIILTSVHGQAIWDMTARRLEAGLQVLRHRMINLYRDPRLGHQYAYMVFGHTAGGLYGHSVLNLTASPFVVPVVRRELDGAYQWYHMKDRCLFSDLYEEEIVKRDTGKPHGVLLETSNFIALIPYFSGHPLEIWILPMDHLGDFTDTPVDRLPELARLLARIMKTLKNTLGPFPYVLSLMNQPNAAWGAGRGYWKTLDRDWMWRI
ncbi:hypothetical protein JXA80_06870, partial [bacterium]|nr:hypothetical protein [candidate division CSSED10-310 bacterium]